MVTDAAQRMAEVPHWYHTLDLAPGVSTPGWFDLRPIADRVPWPDLTGKRCLDVATYDGFFAFEMERRGAAEVVAVDVPTHEDWDWLPRERARGMPDQVEQWVGGRRGRGFEVARDLLGSRVERVWCNAYDVQPDVLGRFDVVVMGALLLHLRDPFRALAAVRSVCDGVFVSVEQVDTITSVLHPRRPVMVVRGARGQWAHPNVAGHRSMLRVSGFDVQEQTSFAEPLGVGHQAYGQRPTSVRTAMRNLAMRARFGAVGVPKSAIRCRPVV